MPEKQSSDKPAAQAGEQLFQFAIDRGDMQSILDSLPPMDQERRVALEYEIQMLRIVSVGWAIAFFLSEHHHKNQYSQHYWEQVRTFSTSLSSSTSLLVGSDIDYFDTLKQRLDFYVAALDAAGEISQPAMVIGPAFAESCGDRQDALATLAGSKMFAHTIHAVREYLDETVV